jgi:hypothetical protein
MKNDDKFISLVFVVSGEQATVDKINVNQPLKVAAIEALKKTDNKGRDISEFEAKYNNNPIDLNQKIDALGLPNGAVIFLTLKIGQGG